MTADVLKTKGKPVKTVEMYFEDQIFQVEVRDGKPLSLEVEQMKLLLEYEGQEHDRAAMEERDLEISRMLFSGMMVDPPFSYQGEGEGIPIETRSSVMIASLAAAFSAVNSPEEDAIFQVTVRRGVPADAFVITGETFEFYPVGGKQKKYTEMSDAELSAEMARNTARRQVLVPAMIVEPRLLYTPVFDESEETVDASEAAVDLPAEADTEGYPVGRCYRSGSYAHTFNEAHRVVNIPAAGVASLKQVSTSSGQKPRRDRIRADESVDNE